MGGHFSTVRSWLDIPINNTDIGPARPVPKQPIGLPFDAKLMNVFPFDWHIIMDGRKNPVSKHWSYGEIMHQHAPNMLDI